MKSLLLSLVCLSLFSAETLYEYDANGWLVGTHSQVGRANSTTIAPTGIPPARARWDGSAWINDPSQEAAAITQENGRRLSQRVVAIAQAKLAASDRSLDEALLRVLYDLCQALPTQKQTPRTQAFVRLIDEAIAEAGN